MEPVKPAIQQPLQNAAVKEGEKVRLDCVIVAQPEPEVPRNFSAFFTDVYNLSFFLPGHF